MSARRGKKPAAGSDGAREELLSLAPSKSRHKLYVDTPRPGRYTHTGYQAASTEGFHAARVIRNEGRAGTAGAAFKHTKLDRRLLLAESRRFRRDNALYEGILGRAVDYIVGTGWDLQPQTSDKKWNAEAERLWAEFCLEPETRRAFSWADVEDLVVSEVLGAGDIGALKVSRGPDAGRLQIFEAELIDSNDAGFTEGIRLSERGRPLEFSVGAYDKSGFLRLDPRNVNRYKAEDFIYCTRLGRFSAVRGYPAMVSAFPMLHRIDDVCDSEAVAWQTISRYAVAIMRQNGAASTYNLSRPDTSAHKGSADLDGDLSRRVVDIDKALLFFGEQGDDIKGISHNIPGANFEQSLVMFLRVLGLPLGIPLELVLLDWSKGNYSGHRAALEQAYRTFVNIQRRVGGGWHAPTYRWKVAGWVRDGRLAERPDQFAHQWIAPSFPWLDQLKEAQGWGAKLDRGLVTHASACKSLNIDRVQLLAARRREIEEAITIAQEIEKKNPGVKVPYEIFCGLRPAGSADAKVPETEKRQPRTPADDAGDGAEPDDGGSDE